ncbi:nucleotidyltransferase family protein [Mucilaginibacter sp. McL0603]|uniref:nucleotidyltransferase family protein n=1 Tax=Mucilaginibacter sp. McL0603 TaxID=3415670 RepID=UPI003CF134EA
MIALIILAAGASTRLGQPKQNLVFQRKTLLERAIETAIDTECRPIFVVLGANVDDIDFDIKSKEVKFIFNSNWNEGMASSIRIAISEIEKHEEINNVLIMLCDQPFVTSKLIAGMLLKQQETGKAIVACKYGDTIGVPALFTRTLFSELLLLRGQEGAKKILKDHPEDVAIIPFDKGNIDIDTKEDYNRLINLDN